MTIVNIGHARKIQCPNGKGYCSRGIRLFFNRYNLNYTEFLVNGIDAEHLIATGDELALAVVSIAKDEENGKW